MDKVKQFIEKWNKFDTRTKIIYGIIAIVLVVALVFSVSSMGGDKSVSDTDLSAPENEEIIVVTDTDTDGEGFDAAMSSTDADAGGEEEDELSETTTTTESTSTTKKTKKTTTTTEKTTTTTEKTTEKTTTTTKSKGAKVSYGESYDTKNEVAAYLAAYGELPPNYITKKEAEAMGWKGKYSTVAQAAPGKSIGGDKFGNYEGILPEKKGRKYYECDIDYKKGNRNAKRIVFSNDGLIFYTEDHYESFVQYDTETGKWK